MSNKIRYISAIQAANKGAAIRVIKFFNKNEGQFAAFLEYCECKIRVITYESDIKDGEKLFKRQSEGLKNLKYFANIIRHGAGDDFNTVVKSLATARGKDDVTGLNFRKLLPSYLYKMNVLQVLSDEIDECMKIQSEVPELAN